MVNTTRPPVDTELLEKVKQVYPETKGLKPKGIVDWALRKIVKEVPVE